MSFNSVPFGNVEISDGFWKEKQKINSNITIHSVRDRFADTGRFEAFKFNWKEGMPNRPHYFWDSDIAKWIESVAYILRREKNDLLEAQVDEVIELIEQHQEDNGYFNIYFTVVMPEARFRNRDWHELYCAGHLMEAAVAYYEATGKDKLLKCMCRYADLIERVFKTEDSAGFHTPGHEEIELALVKLYHCTGEKRYLDLAKYFIDRRGFESEFPDDYWSNPLYYQSHKPCREQFTAEGHSVRACYLYSGMADIAREFDDKELLNACEKIFDDIYYKKMYVTAGLGQSHHGEAFTVPYDLQNGNAYTETCAAIAFVFFASRMQKLRLDSRYGDVIEKAIYNGALSGVSIDGRSFFYENPLEINLARNARNVSIRGEGDRNPITQRLEVFGCSCCPPNITRLIASIGDYIYGEDGETLYIHQFISSRTQINGAEVEMISGYPYDGNIVINTKGADRLAIRIPEYTRDELSIILNGESAEYTIENGYAFIDTPKCAELKIKFDISPKAVYPDPRISADAGKCAVVAGPIVYCAEGKDNGSDLLAFRIPEEIEYSTVKNEELGTVDLIVKAERLTTETFNGLYSTGRKYIAADIHLIPYFAFANRGESDMSVWLTAK